MTPALAAAAKSTSTVMGSDGPAPLNEYIEHTLLKPDTTADNVSRLYEEALEYGFLGICVPPYHVQFAANLIGEESMVLVTVIGFPLGYNATAAKVEEAKKAIHDGADELDMVMNIAAFKSGNTNAVYNDIESIATVANQHSRTLKVIIETALLNKKEIIEACDICSKANVNFVKTSTGFAEAGATVEAVKLMRKQLPDKIGIKAAGGITTAAFARELIAAGANRIGTSSGPKLMSE